MQPLSHSLYTIKNRLNMSEKDFNSTQLKSYQDALAIIHDYMNGKTCYGNNVAYLMSEAARQRAVKVTVPFLYNEINRLNGKIK